MLKIDDRRFNQLATGGVGLSFVLLIAAFAATILSIVYNQRSGELVNRTYRVVEVLARIEISMERAESATRGYLLAPAPVREENYRTNIALIQPALDDLRRLQTKSLLLVGAIDQLEPRIDAELAQLARLMEQAKRGRLVAARAEFDSTVQSGKFDQIRQITRHIRTEEERLLVERIGADQSMVSNLIAVLAVSGLLLLLVAVGSVWLVRRYTSDLTRSRDHLRDANTNLESAVELRTADLQRANDELQRFAYIISHDLRSPLVNVMGFTAELETASRHLVALVARIDVEEPALASNEARLAVNEDMPEAIGFIRSSTQKMERLINAILKLAREGRRSLTPQQLAMTPLIATITDSLEHRLQEKGATIRVEAPLPDIVSDRVAIEQLFSNLIENAVKYLKDGRPGRIVVRGARQGDRLVYEIQDNGRGIDPRDHQRIFDLFRRSGQQDQAGEGIGLAHVRTLAYRLGGTIDCISAVDEGATFRLNLPVTYRDEGPSA